MNEFQKNGYLYVPGSRGFYKEILFEKLLERLPRISPVGIPVHLIQRGNNRHRCVGGYSAYVGWLKAHLKEYAVDIHAWVLMTNHIHLLCTPQQEGGISQMMQSLGRRYVQYFNYRYRRSGTLKNKRMKNYRALFCHYMEGSLLEEISSNINKGMAIGYDRVKNEIEKLTDRRLKTQKAGPSCRVA